MKTDERYDQVMNNEVVTKDEPKPQSSSSSVGTGWIILLAVLATIAIGLIIANAFGLFSKNAVAGQPGGVQVADTGNSFPQLAPVDNELSHLAYWTTATEKDRWPEMDQFDIVACHSDPDENGNAKVVFLIGKISEKDLQLTYFNGYSGQWSDETKSQIISEIQDSVRPHVPGFTLSTVEIIRLP